MKILRLSSIVLIAIAGCSSQVVIKKIDPLPTIPQSLPVNQTVQSLKETLELPKKEEGENQKNRNTPPVVTIPGLEPTVPLPAHTFCCLPLTQTNQQGSGIGGTPTNHFHDPAPTEEKITPQPHNSLVIHSVYLTEGGPSASLVGPDAPAELTPNYEGSIWDVIIEGELKTSPPSTLENYLFTLEFPLIHKSLVGREVPLTVTLDRTILWNVIEASESRIRAQLNVQAIPDTYLRGQHVLSVASPQLISDVSIKIGVPDPAVTPNLSPTIGEIRVLRDDQGRPVNVEVSKSQNLMLYYHWSYSQIDGAFSFSHSSSILDTPDGVEWTQIIHIPDPDSFDQVTEHTLTIATPFGAVFKQFVDTTGGGQ